MNHLYFNYSKPKDKNLKNIYLSFGCFWKKESLFWNIEGIFYTEVGYAECTIDNPSCYDIFSNHKHREVVKVTYDPEIISIQLILDIFFKNHTYYKLENFEVPNLYKSAIYLEQEDDIKKCKEFMISSLKYQENQILTELKEISDYVIAREEHQQYILKNKNYCD